MTMATASERNHDPRHFSGLDLVRGLAALAVLVYHVDFMFGQRKTLLSGGYTAVDLFFILSGFVIAATYEAAVVSGRIDFWGLAKRRFARLYPLYLATTVVGIFVMTARFRANFGYLDAPALLVSAIANLFFLPTPTPVYGGETLFPYNAASWSIFYELVVNAAFFVFFARARSSTLVCLWLLAGAGMIATIVQFGGVDVGWGTPNALAGFPRVCFSFLTGALIWRAYQARPWSVTPWLVVALVTVHLGEMQARLWLPDALKGWSDMGVVALLLPAIVAAGVGARLGGLPDRGARLLGDVSYAVYLTQDALIITVAGLTQSLMKAKIYDYSPWAGVIFVPVCLIESYLVFKFFEVPMRRSLRSVGRPRMARANPPLGAAVTKPRSTTNLARLGEVSPIRHNDDGLP